MKAASGAKKALKSFPTQFPNVPEHSQRPTMMSSLQSVFLVSLLVIAVFIQKGKLHCLTITLTFLLYSVQ